MKNEIRDEKRSITFSLHSLLLFFYFFLFSKKDVNCWRGVDGVAKRRRLTTCTQRASLVQLHCVTLCSGRINSEKKKCGISCRLAHRIRGDQRNRNESIESFRHRRSNCFPPLCFWLEAFFFFFTTKTPPYLSSFPPPLFFSFFSQHDVSSAWVNLFFFICFLTNSEL